MCERRDEMEYIQKSQEYKRRTITPNEFGKTNRKQATLLMIKLTQIKK
ncbi:MAG: hypothetical protein LBF70_01385 [Holosporales bacterium]|jgi:hypothetical protein|nr:hypothetical protein [Holosporales bacterium]